MATKNLLFFDKRGDQYNFQWNGEFWEGSILFPKVSEKLFEVEHIFIIERFLDPDLNIKYGFPHTYSGTSPAVQSVWRTRWASDYDQRIDVSSIIYTYELGVDPELDAPVLVKTDHVEFYPEIVGGDTIDPGTGLVITNSITSSSMQINIALNSDSEGIYDRTLILEDCTDPNNPITILRVNFHGEVEGEDSRLSVLLGNFGRSFMNEDALISRESDIQEPYPDFRIINRKRKELLLEGENIFPYIGSYKALFNAIKFFGYYDLRIKEYWLNIHKDSSIVLTPLQQNQKILNQLKKLNIKGQNSLQLISSLLEDENQGKYKHVEIYGKRKDGTFGLLKKYEEIFPSKSYKKTSLFGLFYDINRVNEAGEEDEFGYPIVNNVFVFSPEEVLIKLFGLKERLKRDYLPLNARIVDITGEGIYFSIYKLRGWSDQLSINEIKSGIKVDFLVTPEVGYIEDLRPFYTKQNQNGLLYPAINGPETGISYYGNTVDPYSSHQQYPLSDIPSLVEAIKKYYQDVKNGVMPKFLGDGDYDPPGYKLFSTGEDYVYPAGCPILIQDNTFVLRWDEINGDWQSLDNGISVTDLNVASYTDTVSPNPGTPFQAVLSSSPITLDDALPRSITINIGTGKDWFNTAQQQIIFVRVESVSNPGNLILGYVISGGYDTTSGDLTIQCISIRGDGTYSEWRVSPTNLSFNSYTFKYFQNYVYAGGFYSWDRLPYLDFYEIEWKIWKEDDRPYHFEIRGPLPGLEILPHFLPYTGEYTIQCRVWDTLNSVSLGIKRRAIKVEKREIRLNAITRFRRSEVYNWDNMPLKWDSYQSQWIFPVENTEKFLSNAEFIQNFPEYSNNFNEGQDCEVLTKLPEVRATAQFDIGLKKIGISSIQSPPIYSPGSPSFISGYGFAVVSTLDQHEYSDGDTVFIYNSDGSPYGQFQITVLDDHSFQIPMIEIAGISGGFVYGEGNIKLIADGVKIADCDFNGSLDAICGSIYSAVNSSPLNPKYKVISIVDSSTPDHKTITIQAPNNSGSLWNNKILEIQASGCILASAASVLFSGGINEREEYLYYDFQGPLPKPEMRYWGTKGLSWDTFEDFEFQKAYAHTWDMFDYHNDWLGGFDLYSLQYGDRIRVTKDSGGVVFKEIDSPQNSYLDLSEAAAQLNGSADENIQRFDYVVRNFSALPDNFSQGGGSISPDLGTTPGPKNIDSKFFLIPGYSPSFIPNGIAWDKNGDIWISGRDVIKFDGANYTIYDSSNSPMPGIGTITTCIKVDRNNTKWIGLSGTQYPLVSINEDEPTKNRAYNILDFVDNNGDPVCPLADSTINSIEINSQNGDIFCSFVSSSPSFNGLLYYCASEKSWKLFTESNSNIGSGNINDLKLEYYGLNKWYLWIATSQSPNKPGGLSRFNGIDFKNYRSNNSGIPSNNVYSIEIDKLNHKWIGTDQGIAYWDTTRWAVWNSSTNPEITPGNIVDIVETGNANIWFVVQTSLDNELYFFDGYHFTRLLYRNDGSTLISPAAGIGQKSLISVPWKTIKNGITMFPRNLLTITTNCEICQIDYVIPHIHAVSKFPGSNGWDFIYHDTSVPLPQIEYIHEASKDPSKLWFTFSPGGYVENLTLNPALIRPKMPSVDRASWHKPVWQRYAIDHLKDQFPALNIDDIFLYAPLRDILNGKATKEEYWRNSQIERIAEKKSRELFDNFEWLITIGNSLNNKGIKITADSEGDIIAIGDFHGDIFMGSVNNIASQDVHLSSPSYRGIYIAKYNKVGVLQWARSHNATPISGHLMARSVTTDINNNIYVAYNYKKLFYPNTSHIVISKWSPDGDLINILNVAVSPISGVSSGFIGDIKIDRYQNIYICGSFRGIINIGSIILQSANNFTSGYVAKFDPEMNLIWIKKITSDADTSVHQLAILQNHDLYITGIFKGVLDLGNEQLAGIGAKDLFIARLNGNNGDSLWSKALAGTPSTVISNSQICLDPKEHLLLTGSFNGQLTIEDKKIDSAGSSDIFIIKLLSTGKLIWIKGCGGDLGDTSHDIESDDEENIYITGSYMGNSYFSPETIHSRGQSDIYLGKFNKDGVLVDIVTAGGIYADSGADLTLDKEENIYLTGYFQGNSDFDPFKAVSQQNTSIKAFIGKIPKKRFTPGYKIGSIQSWFGSHSWSWKEEKLYENELEIPLASTVFINPIDSLIPGKKGHIWTLSDALTGEIIVKLRKTPYFIWTFTKPGFYTISCELQDANGNIYRTEHKGKIRVIDHKEAEAGDLTPEIVNPKDYLLRSIYEDRDSLGFPPLDPFKIA